jgi:hypothetical protein
MAFDLLQFSKKVSDVALAYVTSEVKRSLEDHLSDSSERFHEWIVDKQSNLLHRISTPFIKPAVPRMWEKPEDVVAPHQVVTMMWYFAQLMSTRRDADRRYKRLT